MKSLEYITTKFGRAYRRANQAEAAKKKWQKQFFDGLNAELETRTLARQTISVPSTVAHDEYVKKYHPGWRVVGYEYGFTPDRDKLIIEEDPRFMKHTFVNSVDGQVYGRTTVEGGPSLDDDLLQAEEPELWERISTWPEPWFGLVCDAFRRFTSLPWSDDALTATVGEFLQAHGLQRVLQDLNMLSDEDLALMQTYIIPGSLSTRLVAPRKAKEEELS